jgi:hypothetical protein
MSSKATPHPEDVTIAQEIKEAVAFSVCLHRGALNRETVRDIPSYGEALGVAADLNATSKFGRRAVIYAIHPRGHAHPVDAKLAALAGLA